MTPPDDARHAVALEARQLEVARRSASGEFRLRVDELQLRGGEVLAVLGPNGAGKSTLLRTLAGLVEPAAGKVVSLADGPVTLVFQRPIPFAGSVRHNVSAALLGRAATRAEREAVTRAALERFGIVHLAERRAQTLSGGELRRLVLARALALSPSVLLLDEPFDDLDTAGQESLSLDLRRAIVETGIAVAVVTHDLRRALLLADRIAVLDAGSLAQSGPRDEVLERPVSARVAELVGMTNRLPGVLRRDGDRLRVEVADGFSLPLAEAPAAASPGARLLAGLRPEHLKVDVGRGEGSPIGEGTVKTLVSDGVAALVTVTWGGHELRTHLLAGRGLARTLRVGDRVMLSIRPEDVHVLADESGAAD